MNPWLVFSVVAGYFLLLIFISYLTSRKSDTASFFNGNKKSPWYLVAFGMIGASLSGVTFISVPGWVGSSGFSYFQIVLGYLVGYFAIATVLLPLYYKLNLVSIYKYLAERFGNVSHKTGSAFFLLSRIIGASFRLFLVAGVLQLAFFNAFHIPFVVTVIVTIFLIWIYTFRSGIKTIVWTDTLQTTFMILAVVVSVVAIAKSLNLNFSGIIDTIKVNKQYSQMFFWDFADKHFFVKDFIAGAFIAFVMTGLDQDMMQKNLTCKTLKESQKNVLSLSVILIPVNLLFLSLGVLLYVYANQSGIAIPEASDDLFPMLALNYFGTFAGITFLIGIIAAAFSSADSALTALTTSFSVDFMKLDIEKNDKNTKKVKTLVHLGVSATVVAVILIFKAINNDSVISQIFKVAGYTYGPLLGLFIFGLTTKLKIRDKLVPLIAILSPILSYFIAFLIEKHTSYKFGFELLVMNGALTFLGLLIISYWKREKSYNL
ncbi:MAG: sodium:solute symporter [Bacteroidales bacterium]|nr:sodium:solute symporter [Bacteroidales bacterium]